MKLQPFLPGGELTVEVWANRHQVDLWHFFPGQQQRPWHAFTVDGKMINERDTIEFTFVIRPPRSPFAFNQSADRRQLGLFVEKACFGYRVCHDAFGRVLDFRSASVDTELLWNGWSTPEPTGCWTDGPQAVVGLRLPNRPASDISVAIEASVFGGAENQSDAPITISANGTHVADVDRSSGPPRQLLFTIPHAAIEDDGMLALTIDVPNPISPATLGLSPDTRQIGLHLTKLVMSS